MEPLIDVGIPLSPTVENAAGRFAGEAPIRAWNLVQEILTAHPEYAGGLARKLFDDPGPEGGELRRVEAWLQAVADLVNPQAVRELHGRLVILGLSRVEPALLAYEPAAFLVEELERELREPGPRTFKAKDVIGKTLTSWEKEVKASPRGRVLAALRLADAAAASVGRTADSVLLLAALLATGAGNDGAPSAMLRALDPDGSAVSSEPGRAAAELLHLKGAYGIETMPREVGDDFPPLDAYSAFLGEGGAPPSTSFDDDLRSVLLGARQLARSAGGGAVRARHLVGAMLSARVLDPLPAVQDHLTALGHDVARLRTALLDYVHDHTEGESLDLWGEVLLTPDLPLSAGYVTDMVDLHAPAREPDHLGVEEEAETIAYVLTAKQVRPPLSLGLFGDWGSGKSFFMAKLRGYVEAIADRYAGEEQATGQPSQWCSRVVQIDFNAWHYSDANLWASLVTHIYSELDRALTDKPSDLALKQELETKVKRAEGVVQEAERRLEDAQTRVGDAAAALESARKHRAAAEQGVRALVDDVGALLGEGSETQKALTEAAQALGYPQAAESYEALAALDADLKSFSNRLAVLAVSLLRTPWTLVVLALLVLGLPVAVGLLLPLVASLDAVWQRVAEVSTFLIGLSAGVRLWISRGTGMIETIEGGLREAREVRSRRIEASGAVQEARQTLAAAEAEEQAARERLLSAQTDLQRMKSELAELRPERRLQRLIEERARTAAYSKHLGIISLIRADFEQMSELLVEMMGTRAERDADEPPPIQRIILYIDDLDRCRPARVVEVLEAVHLLLAFPLFVVVVGVDPRWLRHSLTQHYPYTLAPAGRHVVHDPYNGPSLVSTPQDYLEKIFQIPFALRPVEEDGYRNMVGDLLKPLPPFELRELPSAAPEPGAGGDEPASGGDAQPESAGSQGDLAAAQADRAPSEGEAPAADETPPAAEPAPEIPPLRLRALNPQQLDFTDWEKTDIDRLWPMFRTPRTIKRFVNIYRLLRAGLATEEAVMRFEGTAAEPGEYQVALLLLAVMTSFPNQSTRFLYDLNAWLDDEVESGTSGEAPERQWADFAANLLAVVQDGAGDDDNRTAPSLMAPTPDAYTGGAPVQEGAPGTEGVRDQSSDLAWRHLVHALVRVTGAGFQRPFSRDTMTTWIRRVARYSFSVIVR